jgi:hypothetical protein
VPSPALSNCLSLHQGPVDWAEETQPRCSAAGGMSVAELTRGAPVAWSSDESTVEPAGMQVHVAGERVGVRAGEGDGVS